jgi:hypothetical protein
MVKNATPKQDLSTINTKCNLENLPDYGKTVLESGQGFANSSSWLAHSQAEQGKAWGKLGARISQTLPTPYS